MVGGGAGALGLAEVGLRVWEAARAAPVVSGVVEGHKQVRAKGRIKPDLDVIVRRAPTP